MSYTYAKDRLSKITTKSSVYNFTYTTAGLTDTVKVGSNLLVDNAYNPGTWTLASQTYGNGDAWHYSYNDFDELVSAHTTGGETGTELKYFYNSEGALARIEQYDTTLSGTAITARTLVSTERYYYDTADRSTRITRTDTDGDAFECYWEYDHNNNITTLVEVINGETHTFSYTYDNDQRVSSVTTGDTSIVYEYDGYSRVTTQTTKSNGATVLTESFTYRSPAAGFTSTQVETYTVTGSSYSVTYSYQYDANGNILSVTDGTNTTGYTYDSMNQLVRENNQAAGKTWTWTYDNAGNIRSKAEYEYSTGDLGEVVDTIAYAYTDEDWGDLLTAYDGVEITHDEIGNPLNDGTWTYSWENGRQLASMTDGTTTWNYEYNADGLRTSRTNGTTSYEYTYNGSQLVQLVVNYATESETVSRDVLYFTSNTVTYNGTTYYYVTNLQGDIVAILNGTGSTVVTYTYDAWGNILSTSGSMADTLGALNPLRYRGYVYDSESSLYYLQSRYYDPGVGRFLNADAFVSTGQGILGFNMFAYCRNNPVSRTDISGTLDYACNNGDDTLSGNDPTDWTHGSAQYDPYQAILDNGSPAPYIPNIPQQAWDTLEYIKSHNGHPPENYKGGKVYANDGRNGGQKLPKSGEQYHEYDIYPKQPNVNRGLERIVIGRDGSAWYTFDHYQSFTRME